MPAEAGTAGAAPTGDALDPYSTYTLRGPDQRAWSPVARLAKAPDLAPTRLRFNRVGVRRQSRQSMLPARLSPRPPSDQSMEPMQLPSALHAMPRSSSAVDPSAAVKMVYAPSSRSDGAASEGEESSIEEATSLGCKGTTKHHRGLRGLLSSLRHRKAAPAQTGGGGGGKRGTAPRSPRQGASTCNAVVPAPSRAVMAAGPPPRHDRGGGGRKVSSPPSAAAALTAERLAAVGAWELGGAHPPPPVKLPARKAAGGGRTVPHQGRCSVDGGVGRTIGMGRSSIECHAAGPGGGGSGGGGGTGGSGRGRADRGRGATSPPLSPPLSPSGVRSAAIPPRSPPRAPASAGARKAGAAAAARGAKPPPRAGGGAAPPRGGSAGRPPPTPAAARQRCGAGAPVAAAGPRGGVSLGGRSSIDGRTCGAYNQAAAVAGGGGRGAGAGASVAGGRRYK